MQVPLVVELTVLPLPVVYRSRLAVDATPLVRELASVEDEFGRLLTVVLDRTSARFFEVTAYATQELNGLRADSTRGKRFHGDQDGSGGWGEHTYNNRIRAEKQRHLDAIARELFAIDRANPAHGIVVATARHRQQRQRRQHRRGSDDPPRHPAASPGPGSPARYRRTEVWFAGPT